MVRNRPRRRYEEEGPEFRGRLRARCDALLRIASWAPMDGTTCRGRPDAASRLSRVAARGGSHWPGPRIPATGPAPHQEHRTGSRPAIADRDSAGVKVTGSRFSGRALAVHRATTSAARHDSNGMAATSRRSSGPRIVETVSEAARPGPGRRRRRPLRPRSRPASMPAAGEQPGIVASHPLRASRPRESRAQRSGG